jgi:hypothetical protein
MGELKELKYRFRSGAVRNGGIGYVLGIDEDLQSEALPHTVFYMWYENQWNGFDLSKWNALSVCVPSNPKEQMVAIGEHGNVRVIGSGDDGEEMIADGDNTPESRGPLREVRTIGGRAYACGMDRQVYRREAPGLWKCIDGNMRKIPAADPVFGFESVHGFSEKDIYAVGWHGEVWHFSGRQWQRIEMPTNAILTRVLCAGDKNVYIAGRSGLLIRGRGNAWSIVPQDGVGADLWDLEWFGDRLYASTTRAIYTLEGDDLTVVETDDEVPASCYHLDARDGILWSIGEEDILEFDGEEWKRIE